MTGEMRSQGTRELEAGCNYVTLTDEKEESGREWTVKS